MADETDISIFNFGKKKKPKDHHDSVSPSTSTIDQIDSITMGPIVSRPAPNNFYNTNHANIGVALIFNHRDIRGQAPRIGTEKDRSRTKKTLASYGFETRTYDDKTFEEISYILDQTAKEDHSQNDCLMVVLMSHGSPGKVFAKDMEYPVERLWTPFFGENCRTLIGKPKIFFIQACRGELYEQPVQFADIKFSTMSRSLDVPDATPVQEIYAIPNTADLLVFYSTYENSYSWRNPVNGSWFIQTICQILEEYESVGESVELYSFLTAVNRRVAYEYQSNVPQNKRMDEMKEMPNFVSTLTKLFFFKPKN